MQPDDVEPDYRMSLAAERTYLAYIRTSLAMLAGGVAVVGALSDLAHERLRQVIGVLLVCAGLFLAVSARSRFRQVETAMRRGSPLPATRTPVVITVATVAAALLALVLVLVI